MYSETFRPNFLDDVIGHQEAKESLRKYLCSSNFKAAQARVNSLFKSKTCCSQLSGTKCTFF